MLSILTPHLSLLISSLRVGRPRLFEELRTNSETRAWTSALLKEPLTGPVWLSATNLAGDEQADLRSHGGPEQALCVYPSVHYRYWSTRLGQPLTTGSFGENLALDEPWVETDVCIGDIFAFGEAIIQISQPRAHFTPPLACPRPVCCSVALADSSVVAAQRPSYSVAPVPESASGLCR